MIYILNINICLKSHSGIKQHSLMQSFLVRCSSHSKEPLDSVTNDKGTTISAIIIDINAEKFKIS